MEEKDKILKWNIPKLQQIQANHNRTVALDCTNGSGDAANCMNGNGALSGCNPVGNSAGGGCNEGVSAVAFCFAGSPGSAP